MLKKKSMSSCTSGGPTRSMLEGREPRLAGVGLAAFMLCLLPAAISCTALGLLPSAPRPATLLGLETFFATAGAGFGTAAGCSVIRTAGGRRNMPLPISQSKYRSPCMLPSFLPLSSSSSTPIQSPAAK